MAWLSFARARPIALSAGNFKKGGMVSPLQGLVLHIMEGSEDGTFGWFNTKVADRQRALDAGWEKRGRPGPRPIAGPSSAHFGNPKSGQLEQFVDTDDQAFAQKGGNPAWLSVENEGKSGDSLTPSQLSNLAQLMAYLNFNHGVPLKEANTPSESGLGYHGMGGGGWGGHLQCPGRPIIGQRSLILRAADGLMHGHRARLEFDPIGRWRVKVDRWVWEYTFAAKGAVSWIDPFNKMTGKGKWRVIGETITFAWDQSTTKETWNLPLDPRDQRGTCVMKGKTYEVHATRM